MFRPEESFEGTLMTEQIGNVLANIITDNKLSLFTKLVFTSYKNIDVSKEKIVCDKKALEMIEKEGTLFYLREHFFKIKCTNDYTNIAFDYYDESQEKGVITIYYINN